MASLSKRKNSGSYSVQFQDRDGRRRTVTLGKMPKRDAETLRRRIEALAFAQVSGAAPDPELARWLSTAPEGLREKLTRVGLADLRPGGALGAFVDSFLAARRADPSIKPSTIRSSLATYKHLRGYFGEEKALRSITKGDAKAWRVAASRGRRDNTVRKWTAFAKLLFNSAIEHELIETNPFAGLTSTMRTVRERDYHVTREEAAKVLDACPTLEWRLIFALARYGGLRCPSEVLALRWDDVLWDQQRFIVRSGKTAHHEGRESRIVPLFPELEPLLREAHKTKEDRSQHVVAMTRYRADNLRTQMARIIESAGIKPWPKLFQNLRATRATELADQFPGHVAAAWLGHTVKVAKQSYWQVTDEHFTSAVSGNGLLQNALQQALAAGRIESQDGTNTAVDAAVCEVARLLATQAVGDTGFEPVTSAV